MSIPRIGPAFNAPDTLPPSGPAGGDLSGTYPDPSVVDDSHDHTVSTITDISTNYLKLDASNDPVTGTLTLQPSTNTQALILKANASQTNANPLLRFQNSAGSTLFNIHSDSTSNIFINTTNSTSNTGTFNIYIGQGSGAQNTTGTQNVGIGNSALNANTTGGFNVGLGVSACLSNTTGLHNFGMGVSALRNNTTGGLNVALGSSALQNMRTSGSITSIADNGSGNARITSSSHQQKDGMQVTISGTTDHNGTWTISGVTANTYDITDPFVSNQTGTWVSTGSNLANNNIAIGRAALQNNVTGTGNVAIGRNAGATGLNTGSQNVFIGDQAGQNETGSNKLYIESTNSTTPLIYGEFDNDLVKINGALGCDSITNTTGLAAGTYTPTRSAEANLDANVTMTQAQYLRVGNTVTVSGRFTADPTLTATATSFEITLPVASNIGAAEDVAGVCSCGTIAGMTGAITGSVANDTAVVSWISSDITSQSWSYQFSYQVI